MTGGERLPRVVAVRQEETDARERSLEKPVVVGPGLDAMEKQDHPRSTPLDKRQQPKEMEVPH